MTVVSLRPVVAAAAATLYMNVACLGLVRLGSMAEDG
jgi:hypothetical protein